MPASTAYLALLRGINVGGNNLIKMAALKECFDQNGFADVSTHIQSGNVLFRSRAKEVKRLTGRVERMLSEEFGYEARVAIVTHAELRAIVEKAPEGFGSRPDERLSDVVFLMPPLSVREAMEHVQIREGVDESFAGKGVIYFSRLKARATSSRLNKIASSPVYADMTIRSWSTTTKLLGKLDDAEVSG